MKRWIGKTRSLWLEILVLSLISTALLVHGLHMVGDFRIDDAYITFAYSKNVALGRGPIYGHDLRVEGYSNFLWMMLVAGGEWLGVSALTTARVLSHLAYALLLGATFFGARRLAGRYPAALAVLILACTTDLHRLIASGLETVLYCALIGAGCVHYLVEDKQRRRWSLLWFSGAALTRIDGFVPLLTLLGLELGRLVLLRRWTLFPSFFRWAAWGVVPVAAFWVWRVSYYGLLFPLPYYAKASLGMLEFDRGVDYVQNGLRETGLWLAIPFAVYGVSLTERRPKVVIATFLAVLALYVAYVGGDWMPFNRMLVPLEAPLLVLAATGMRRLLDEGRRLGLFVRGLVVTVIAAASMFMAQHLNQLTLDTPLEKGKIGHTNHLLQHTQGLVDALPFVAAMVREPGDTLVTDYGGVYAYGTDASVIEMWGLANREIALRGNTDGINAIYGKTCVPCYAEFQPDYFHSVTPLLRGEHDFRSVGQLIGQIFQGRAIDRVIGLRKNFVLGRVRRPTTGQTLWFLERKRDGVDFEPRRVGDLVVDYPKLERQFRPNRPGANDGAR